MKKTITLGAALCLVALTAAHADVLITRAKEHKGTFEGYVKNTFSFRTTGGEMLQEDRSKVLELTLDKPCKVAVLKARKKSTEASLFKQYKKLKFIFKKGKKDQPVFANHIKEITVNRPPPPGGGGGGAPGKGDEVIPPLNIGAVENNPDLTIAQKASLERYKSARQKYETFLRESSTLVAQMDAARGANREKFLNELRMRKNQEQPIKRDLEAAMSAVMAAFPKSQ